MNLGYLSADVLDHSHYGYLAMGLSVLRGRILEKCHGGRTLKAARMSAAH
jgi:hypothetical protein